MRFLTNSLLGGNGGNQLCAPGGWVHKAHVGTVLPIALIVVIVPPGLHVLVCTHCTHILIVVIVPPGLHVLAY
jgi:hypothetical protein